MTFTPDELQIRPVEPADAPAIHRLISEIFADYGYVFDPLVEDRHLADPCDFFGRAGGAFWVVVHRDRVIATVGAIPAPDDDERPYDDAGPNPPDAARQSVGQLKALYVHRAARRAGLGGRLVQLCLEWLRAAGCSTVILWTDTQFTDAHRLYERAGFRRAGVRHVTHANAYSEYKYELRGDARTVQRENPCA